MRILYNSTNHDVVCTDQDVEYTNHDVVYIFHGDNLEIDEIVIIFVYSKKNVFYLGRRGDALTCQSGNSVKQLDSVVKILDSSKRIAFCYLIVV